MANKAARILIVDDHPIIREGLAAMIARRPDLEVCGEADGIPSALALVESTRPDLAIIDMSLQDGNGLDLIKRIKARGVSTRMLVLSMHDDALYAERALRAGAMGYLNKHEARDSLIEAIRLVLQDKVYLSPAMHEQLLSHLVIDQADPLRDPVESLSNRELEVFDLIGRGLTIGDIAARLHLGVKTVETHRQRIKTKLRLRTSADVLRRATQWVMEHG
jgi:DNA-binding NarL/FixJ family response regulator